MARPPKAPVSLDDLTVPRSDRLSVSWVEWWRLVTVTGSTCRRLRTALVGPSSGQLYRWMFLQSPQAEMQDMHFCMGGPRMHRGGLLQWQLRQAAHAHSVIILGCAWSQQELTTVLRSLTSLQHLVLWQHRAQDSHILAALPCRLRRLTVQGDLRLPSCGLPQGLQQLTLAPNGLSAADVKGLAAQLPTLQRTVLTLPCEQSAQACDLKLLCLLPTKQLRVRLMHHELDSHFVVRSLQQLAGVQLHTLELHFHHCGWMTRALTLLVNQCQVSHSFRLRAWTPLIAAKRLQCLRSGAVVVYEGQKDMGSFCAEA